MYLCLFIDAYIYIYRIYTLGDVYSCISSIEKWKGYTTICSGFVH